VSADPRAPTFFKIAFDATDLIASGLLRHPDLLRAAHSADNARTQGLSDLEWPGEAAVSRHC
jgi:hypothetical protein